MPHDSDMATTLAQSRSRAGALADAGTPRGPFTRVGEMTRDQSRSELAIDRRRAQQREGT